MAAITITATSVLKQSDASVTDDYVAGETITAGQALYRKSADGKWWLSQCDGTAEEATFAGIALNGGAAGQPIQVQTAGTIAIGGTIVVGTIYCVGTTAGAIVPWADLASTNKVVVIGYGSSAGQIVIDPLLTGVSIP